MSGLGSVNITGTAGDALPSNSGTVVASGNTTAGIRINQTPGGAGLVTNSISGLVSWGNTNYGMRLFGGSLVKVRNSVLLGNLQYGVIVGGANGVGRRRHLQRSTSARPATRGRTGSRPRSARPAPTRTAASASLSRTASGACLAGGPLTENLSAEGNEMVSTVNAQVDCSTSTATVTKGACGAQRSDGINAAMNVTTTVDVAGCM